MTRAKPKYPWEKKTQEKTAAKRAEKKAAKKDAPSDTPAKPKREKPRRHGRMYSKAIFTGFKRGQRNQHENTALLKVLGCAVKDDTAFYVGKKVVYLYKAKNRAPVKGNTKWKTRVRAIWGKITRAHGCRGSVRAKFTSNLPPVAMGKQVRISSSGQAEAAVQAALAAGYRHIDTAFSYLNESDIGKALKTWIDAGGKREDLFIVTKLPVFGNVPESVPRYAKESLKRLQLDYIDLYLLHGPCGLRPDPSGERLLLDDEGKPHIDPSTNLIGIWQAMESLVDSGLARSIGLSNVNTKQLRRIASGARQPISVLQVELHAALQQPKLRKTASELGVVIVAYSPLGSPSARQHFAAKYNHKQDNVPDLLGEPLVRELSQQYHKTPGQILLRFLLHLGVGVIPKSSNPTRIAENINIFDFELKPTEIEALKTLDRGEKARIFNFLFWRGIEKHPEYPFEIPDQGGDSPKQS